MLSTFMQSISRQHELTKLTSWLARPGILKGTSSKLLWSRFEQTEESTTVADTTFEVLPQLRRSKFHVKPASSNTGLTGEQVGVLEDLQGATYDPDDVYVYPVAWTCEACIKE